MPRVATASLAMLLGACFSKPPGPDQLDSRSDAMIIGDTVITDGVATDAQLGPCTLREGFSTNALDCGNWATSTSVSGTGSVVVAAGSLAFTIPSGTTGDVSCTSNALVLFTTVTAEIVAPPTTMDSTATLSVDFTSGDYASVVVRNTGAGFKWHFSAGGSDSQEYDVNLATAPFVRMSRSGAGVGIAWGDGTSTTGISQLSVALPASDVPARITLRTDVVTSDNSDQTIRFDNLDACQ